MTDLLFAGLKATLKISTDSWVIGGDFNASETFDEWKGGPRGNREYLDRMASLNLVECLRQYQGKLTPTFQNTSNGEIKHQMDHMFVDQKLGQSLITCITGKQEYIFDSKLSDHLPIIAEFKA